MLQHSSPFKIDENFNLLAHLEDGRVDLGVGKAPGGLPLSTKVLQYYRTTTNNDFKIRLTLLNQLIKQSLLDDHEYAG